MKLYRYEIQYKNDEDPVNLILRTYPVKRETEKTYFIEWNWKEKRIKKDAYNTFAYTTKEKAMEHFQRRTQRRIEWFDYWKRNCQTALELSEKIYDGIFIEDSNDVIYEKLK